MIPPELRTAKGQLLARELDAAGAAAFNWLRPLPADFEQFGRIIQLSNAIDFNLRRAIAGFASARVLSYTGKKPYYLIPTNDLVSVIGSTLISVRHSDSACVKMLQEIQLLRSYRNFFAHWVIVRFPVQDAFAFFTFDGVVVKKLGGVFVDDTAITASMYAEQIDAILSRVAASEKWIAFKTADWLAEYLVDSGPVHS